MNATIKLLNTLPWLGASRCTNWCTMTYSPVGRGRSSSSLFSVSRPAVDMDAHFVVMGSDLDRSQTHADTCGRVVGGPAQVLGVVPGRGNPLRLPVVGRCDTGQARDLPRHHYSYAFQPQQGIRRGDHLAGAHDGPQDFVELGAESAFLLAVPAVVRVLPKEVVDGPRLAGVTAGVVASSAV